MVKGDDHDDEYVEQRRWHDNMKPYEVWTARMQFNLHQREVHKQLAAMHLQKAREYTEEIRKQEASLQRSR